MGCERRHNQTSWQRPRACSLLSEAQDCVPACACGVELVEATPAQVGGGHRYISGPAQAKPYSYLIVSCLHWQQSPLAFYTDVRGNEIATRARCTNHHALHESSLMCTVLYI